MAIDIDVVNEIINDCLPDDDIYIEYQGKKYVISILTSSNVIECKEIYSRFDEENDLSKIDDKKVYTFNSIEEAKKEYIIQGEKLGDILDKLDNIYY